MPLDELPAEERMCENCSSHISAREVCQALCPWCERYATHPYLGEIKDQWDESRTSRLERAETRIAELEAALRTIHDRAHTWNAIPLCVEIERMAAEVLGLKGGA